jgi:hypothetical protein
MPGREIFDRLFSDRDEDEDAGYSGGSSSSYDGDEDEDGGWTSHKDHSESLWDSAEDSDDDEEEGSVAPVVDAGDDDEEGDLFGESIGPRRRGRKPAEKPIVRSVFETTGEMPIPSAPTPVVKAVEKATKAVKEVAAKVEKIGFPPANGGPPTPSTPALTARSRSGPTD